MNKYDENKKEQPILMVNPKDFDEGEIELWQLLLNLLKYKVQLILVILAGLVLGIGLSWNEFKSQKTVPTEIEDQIEYFTDLSGKYKTQADRYFSKIINLLQEFDKDQTIVEVVSLEYQYSTVDDPDSPRIIEFSNMDWLNPAVRTSPDFNSNTYLTIKQNQVEDLVNRVKNITKDQYDIDIEIGKLNTLQFIKRVLKLDNDSEAYKNSVNGISKNNAAIDINKYRETLTKTYEDLEGKKSFLLFSLSQNIDFSITQMKVPLMFWEDIATQMHNLELRKKRLGSDPNRRPEAKRIRQKEGLKERLNTNLEFANIYKNIVICLKEGFSYEQAYEQLSVFGGRSPEIAPVIAKPEFNPMNRITYICIAFGFVTGIVLVVLRILLPLGKQREKISIKEAAMNWKI